MDPDLDALEAVRFGGFDRLVDPVLMNGDEVDSHDVLTEDLVKRLMDSAALAAALEADRVTAGILDLNKNIKQLKNSQANLCHLCNSILFYRK